MKLNSFNFYVCLLVLGISSNRVSGQLGFTWTKTTNDPTAYITFDDISRKNKIEFDTLNCYCSPGYKVLFTRSKMDSVTGLDLGKTYYVRSIQVDDNDRNIGTWKATTNYNVAGYAVSELLNKNGSIIENTKPVLNTWYQIGNESRMELYYDTVPTFNSPAFRDYSNTVNPSYSFFTTTHAKEYYLKARTTYKNQVLPEKIIKVRNNFKPLLQTFIGQCAPGPPSIQIYINHVYSNLPTYYMGKQFIFINGVWDSMPITSSTTNRLLTIRDTNPIRYYSWQRVSLGGDTVLIRDSGILANPIFNGPYIFQPGNTANHEVFMISAYNCPTNFEFQIWKDSTFSSLKQSRNKLVSGTTGYDTVVLKFNMYDNNIIKYRFQRGGIWSGWKYFSRKHYKPSTYGDPQYALNRPGAYCYLNHYNVYNGKWVEVELDSLPSFSTGWKKTFLINDTSLLQVPIYYRNWQYIRVRQTDGKWKSPWSKTFAQVNQSKGKTPKLDCNCTYPSISFTKLASPLYSFYDIEYGASRNNLKYALKNKATIMDSTPIATGDTIFSRIRYRTLFDTLYWSDISACPYAKANYYCVNPHVSWVGKQQGKDTIHVRYKDKDPSYTEGMLLLIADKNKNIVGFRKLNSGTSLAVVHTNQLPTAGWITVISNCSNLNKIADGTYSWHPYSNISLGEEVYSKANAYFNTETKTLVFPDATPRNIDLYDLSGKLLLQVHTELDEFSLQNIQTGVYVVSISRNNTRTSFKIIIP